MKKIIGVILLFSLSLYGCGSSGNASQAQSERQTATEKGATPSDTEQSGSILYKNTEYGFTFKLPKTWENYSIVTDKWEGLAISSSDTEKVIETGPMISIRNPKWTAENPYQDIPILIFTLEQWNLLQQEKFHIGAAPIGPSELNRNEKYVFALPARYNFAFPTGYEEVEQILEGKPLEVSGD